MNSLLRVTRHHLTLRALVLASLAVAALASGCSSPRLVRVQPWERAALTDPLMRPDRDPLHTAMSDHIYFSREASTGGRGVGGTGCGCN